MSSKTLHRDILYQVIEHSSPSELMKLCRTNKDIHESCKKRVYLLAKSKLNGKILSKLGVKAQIAKMVQDYSYAQTMRSQIKIMKIITQKVAPIIMSIVRNVIVSRDLHESRKTLNSMIPIMDKLSRKLNIELLKAKTDAKRKTLLESGNKMQRYLDEMKYYQMYI